MGSINAWDLDFVRLKPERRSLGFIKDKYAHLVEETTREVGIGVYTKPDPDDNWVELYTYYAGDLTKWWDVYNAKRKWSFDDIL